MGDLSIIYPVLDKSYTFAMTGMEEPVTRDKFRKFLKQFRKDAEAEGGPGVESEDFNKFTNVIRRKVTEIVVDSMLSNKFSESCRVTEHELGISQL